MISNISALSHEFLEASQTDPFGTWLVFENSADAKRAGKETGTFLKDHITTPKGLAAEILKSENPEIRIISAEEQFLIFSEIINQPEIKKERRIIPDSAVENIISLYMLLTSNCKSLGYDTEKSILINKIFSKYREWCIKNKCIDAITAIKKASEIEKENISINKLIYCGKLSRDKINYRLIAPLNPEICELNTESENKPLINTASYNSIKTEIRAILEKISELVEDGVNESDIMILLPSYEGTLQLIEEQMRDFSVPIGDNNEGRRRLKYTSPKGTPIINIPSVRCVIAFLSAYANNFKTEDIAAVISSPYFSENWRITAGELKKISIITGITSGRSSWEKADEKLNAAINEKIKDETDPALIKRYENKIEANSSKCDCIKRIINKIKVDGNTWQERCESLRKTLKKFRWGQSDFMTTQDIDAAKSFLSLIDKLEKTSAADKPVSMNEFYSAISRFCSTNTLIHRSDENGIVISLISSAYPDAADYVFIADLNSAKIPYTESSLPMLTSYESQLIWGERITESISEQKENFEKALCSARKQLYLSYSETADGRNYTASPYLLKISDIKPSKNIAELHSRTGCQKTAGRLISSEKIKECSKLFGLTSMPDTINKIRVEAKRKSGEGCEYDADFSNVLSEEFNKKYGDENDVFSPTSLESYSKCPFKWYLSHHLKIKSAEEEGKLNIILGNVIHKSLEEFHRTFRNPITIENKDEALQNLKDIVNKNMDSAKIESPKWQADLDCYLGNGTASSLEKLIDFECIISHEGYTTEPQYLEHKIKASFKSDDGRILKIEGFADRIIINPDTDEFCVIDYKTGTPPSISDVRDSKYALQLPLYIKAFEQERGMKCSADKSGFYLKIAPKKAEVINPFKTKKSDNRNSEDIISESVEKCFEIREGMKKGICSAAKERDCPDRYCMYNKICRHIQKNLGDGI